MANDVSKLPKWAQDRIGQLERSVEHWRAKALLGPDDSNTFAGGIGSPEWMGKPVGRDVPVAFMLTERTKFVVRLDSQRGTLEVHTTGESRMGEASDDVLVAPKGSNTVVLRHDVERG